MCKFHWCSFLRQGTLRIPRLTLIFLSTTDISLGESFVILLPMHFLSIVIICSSKTKDSFSSPVFVVRTIWVGRNFFVAVLLVIGATIATGPCLLAALLETINAGLIPDWTDPSTALPRLQILISPRLIFLIWITSDLETIKETIYGSTSPCGGWYKPEQLVCINRRIAPSVVCILIIFPIIYSVTHRCGNTTKPKVCCHFGHGSCTHPCQAWTYLYKYHYHQMYHRHISSNLIYLRL